MSDISGTSITISGDSNDTNLMIHSTSGTITDGDGSAAAAAAASVVDASGFAFAALASQSAAADSATTATTQATAAAAFAASATSSAASATSSAASATSSAASATSSANTSVYTAVAAQATANLGVSNTETSLANYYKFLIPNNLLTAAVDSSLVFKPHPVLTPTLTIPQSGVLSKVQGMNFPEYGYNCFGVMATSLLLCDMVRTSTTTTPTNLINNVDIQKLIGTFSTALKGEVDLGFNYAVMTDNSKLESGGGPNALAISDASATYSANYWSPADFSANHAAFSALKPAIDALASQWTIPGDASYQLFDFAEGVHLMHIQRVAELSQLADVSWGNSSVNALNTANLKTSPSNSSFMQVFGGLTGALAANPILPVDQLNDSLRENLAESYKFLIPNNVLIGVPDSSLVFKPHPMLTPTLTIPQSGVLSKVQGMNFPEYGYNCFGVMATSLLLCDMVRTSTTTTPTNLINNVDIQKLIGTFSTALKGEVDLGFNYAVMTDNSKLESGGGPNALAISDASATYSANYWSPADFSANHAAFSALKPAIDALASQWTIPGDASYQLFDFAENVHLIHIQRAAQLSQLADVSWGDSTVNTLNAASMGSNTTSFMQVFGGLTGALAANPIVPINALTGQVNTGSFLPA